MSLFAKALKTWFGVSLFLPSALQGQNSDETRCGLKVGWQMFDSFNNFGVGPTVSFLYGRHEAGGGYLWMQYGRGGMPYYRFWVPQNHQLVNPFIQLAVPMTYNKARATSYSEDGVETHYDDRTFGIHLSIGAELKIWKGLKFFTAAGVGHNWMRFVDPPYDWDYDVHTANLQFGMSYEFSLSKWDRLSNEVGVEPTPQGRLHLGLQTEYELPQRISMNPRPGAFTYHPYLEYRFARRMRVQGSVMVGGETAGGTEPDVEWGVRGVGLGVRFYSWQLKGLQFFHTVGGVFVPKPYGYLYGSQVHLANGFSFDFAKYGSLEAGMNLRFNTNTYYLAPFVGLAGRLPELGKKNR